MSTVTLAPAARPAVVNWISDGWVVTKRNLLRMWRSPDILIFAIIQPIMFILLFTQVYGNAIPIEGIDYTQYLMAGIFAQTVVFGATFSGSFMAQDLKSGMIDRFRTLPMSPTAVLIGRTNSDLVLNALSLLIMVLSGFVVGWRFNKGLGEFFVAMALLLLFSYAFSWVMCLLGMLVRSPETINNASFIILFPITMISNAFVMSASLPGPLRWFAENLNPVSALGQATRELFGNTGTMPVPDTWLMQNSILGVVVLSAILLVIFVPLATARFRAISSR
ncbi:ABC transporter permease [Haematomicrobium sanguinis]|uniref:ABC transporter permease n=1 Tax=Haematomicrobium sanguinis TaxID=479106 RepID=UPI00068F0D76|nr:ABC transporter permease [Haematomicrobium sanguinis]